MTRPLIFGFTGRARSGKSTACKAVQEQCWAAGTTAGIYDIGQAVIDYCVEGGLLPRKPREELTADELAVVVRESNAASKVNPDCWLRQIRQAIQRDNFEVALIPNVRLQNEVAFVHSPGGYIVKVTRLNKNGSTYISADRDPNHILETDLALIPADFYITCNTGDPELVNLQAVAIYEFVTWCEASRALSG